MSADEAITHLANRAARACDALGNKGNTAHWTLQDVEAVHTLKRHLATVVEIAELRVGAA